ncbi:dihydrofolate reductase family protein [Acidovorax delafieldii]|uniref:dihydrofolate reductase family protein n=1 Tax=Acidovorax delafieldii TaxID=47920 RepID=UPI00286A316C|nr:dihydrofolate reductase family protein [Acidovorax delafieldii]
MGLAAFGHEGVLLGSGKLANELDRLDVIDEYKLLVHPRIAGHGPTLYECGLPSTRRLQLRSAKPLRSGVVAMRYRRALTRRWVICLPVGCTRMGFALLCTLASDGVDGSFCDVAIRSQPCSCC